MSKNVFDIKPNTQKPPNDQQHVSQNYATGNDIQTVKRYVCNLIQRNIVAFCFCYSNILSDINLYSDSAQNKTKGGNYGRNNQTGCHS